MSIIQALHDMYIMSFATYIGDMGEGLFNVIGLGEIVSVPNYNQFYFMQILNKEDKPVHVNKQYSLNSVVRTCACVRVRAKERARKSTPPPP